MHSSRPNRADPVAKLLLGTALAALALAPSIVAAQPTLREGDEMGFVVSHIEYALSRSAEETGACPEGMTTGYDDPAEVFVPRPRAARREGETERDYRRRIEAAALDDRGTRDLCLHPELGPPDPRFRTVRGAGVPVYGIDLDGRDSRADAPTPGACTHDDFRGIDGVRGVDNQFFRVVGCSASFQPTGQSNTFAIGMLTGSWGILLTLSGVDDLRDDDEVEVGFYSSADPIELGPGRQPLPHATYAIDRSPRFWATTKGRIEAGVLTTTPVDLNFRYEVNTIRLERPLRDAIARFELDESGGLHGTLAGYTEVEAAYDVQYGFRNGLDGRDEPAALRLLRGSSTGQARVQGHTCHGAWQALHRLADGHRDPETGRCTSISTQYRIEAIPAFVVDVATSSANEALDG